MAVGQRLHLRLFLEGVEVPVVSADIQSTEGAAAMAAIQIPANDYAMDLKPRTLVHLFAYDFYHGAPEDRVTIRQQGLTIRESPGLSEGELSILQPDRFENTEEQTLVDIENEKYKLIFGGELVGISMQKTPISRAIVLQCADFSSYWDIAFQYMVSGFSLGRGGMKAAFSNANTQLFRDFFKGSADIITELLNTPPRSYPGLKGTLLGGLMHLIEAIGGTYFGDKAVVGANDFFSLAELRLHLTQMVGANPFPSQDEKKLLSARGFASLFRKNLSGLGKQVSIRQVLQALEKYIFHQIIPITSPRFIPAQIDPNAENFDLIPAKYDKASKPVMDFAKSLQAKAQDLIDRIGANSEGSDMSDDRGGLSLELSRAIKQAKNAENRARQIGKADNVGLEGGDFFGLPEASRAFAATANHLTQLLTAFKELGGLPRSGSAEAEAATKRLTEIRDELMPQVLQAQRRARLRRSFRQPNPPPRLLQQIYRPDVWMVAPPRCNVLFPELYTSFNYGRDFNSEVTRLMLRTHDAFFGSDILFDGFYFAPSRLLGSRTQRKHREKDPDVMAAPAHIVRDMMEHELYTGVIPAFERMSDLNLNVLRGGGSVEIDGMRVGYAQLAANHIFHQYRFRARQLSVEAKYNPFFVLGFPALVIDKYVYYDEEKSAGALNDRATEAILMASADGEGIGLEETTQAQREAAEARMADLQRALEAGREQAHYLGTPASISHSISADSGGRTSIQMAYARTTNEKTEYLGDNTVTARKARKVRTQKVRHRVGCLDVPQVGWVGPRGGEITSVRDITDEVRRIRYVGEDTESGRLQGSQLTALGIDERADDSRIGYRYERFGNATLTRNRSAVTGQRTLRSTELPLYIPNRQRAGRTRDRALRVPVAVEQPVAHYGPAVTALVGSAGEVQVTGEQANSLLLIRAYEITEEIGVYRREEFDLPPEEITFPPWYGEKYRTQQIGSLYGYFFGTGSIVDPLAAGKSSSGGSSRAVDTSSSITESDAALRPLEDVEAPSEGMTAAQVEEGEYLGPADVDFGEVKAGASIAEAVDSVVNIYSRVKSGKQDVNEFIRGYTWRPIATAVDILGTANLQINDDGDVVRGIEGFHSRAFGDYDDLRTLVSQDGMSGKRRVLGIPLEGNERQDGISARLDTRKEKRTMVLKYLHALLASRGILG